MNTTWLAHNKVRLALHHLADGPGRPLLLLHGLGESAPTAPPPWARATAQANGSRGPEGSEGGWPGPIAALDFTGHGESTVPAGGGYSAEILLADADIALAAMADPTVGVTVVGRGIGAYIALMLAGARPHLVHGAILCDGPGLAGGAVGPTSQSFVVLQPRAAPPDPYALFELSRDLRPPDYATLFVRLAVEGSGLEEPIAVTGIVRPPWLSAVVDEVGVTVTTLPDALALYAR
jgi:pimeloyl-ACP methyl ester carboxylesterase